MGFCSYTVILILVGHQVSFVYGGNGFLIGFLYATGTGEKKVCNNKTPLTAYLRTDMLQMILVVFSQNQLLF